MTKRATLTRERGVQDFSFLDEPVLGNYDNIGGTAGTSFRNRRKLSLISSLWVNVTFPTMNVKMTVIDINAKVTSNDVKNPQYSMT